jgi:hypothetical protein
MPVIELPLSAAACAGGFLGSDTPYCFGNGHPKIGTRPQYQRSMPFSVNRRLIESSDVRSLNAQKVPARSRGERSFLAMIVTPQIGEFTHTKYGH